MPYMDGRHIRQALTHELVHNCVAHLRLPLWLNEGLAVIFARSVAEWSVPILEGDLRERQLEFWNSQNIQEFWSGVSFQQAGDSNELSYGLAEIVVNLLLSASKEQHKDFATFVGKADWKDGGQMAALEILGSDLGKTMGTFLGEGSWRPNEKVMAECWEAAKRC